MFYVPFEKFCEVLRETEGYKSNRTKRAIFMISGRGGGINSKCRNHGRDRER